MGDMGDDFRAWNEDKKAKKRSNKEFSTEALIEKGVKFTSHNSGSHLKIGDVDFWPSTGLIMRKGQHLGRGFKKLLKIIESSK